MTTATQNGHGPVAVAPDDSSENPLHRLTPEQIEEIGKEFEALHEQVKADLDLRSKSSRSSRGSPARPGRRSSRTTSPGR
jgi:hypothetical protein